MSKPTIEMKVSLFRLSLMLVISLISCSTTWAQDETEPVNVTVQTLITDFRNEAINLGIDYARSLDSLFKVQDILIANKKSLFQLTPGISVQSGTEDAFSSIQLKLSGIFMTFRTTYIGNQQTPDLTKGFQTFPISMGIETNNRFNILNSVAEVGWVPWFRKKPESKASNPFRTIRLGLFLQSGYKFMLYEDTMAMQIPMDPMNECNGDCDESAEPPNSLLLRSKASIKINTQNLLNFGNGGLGLSGIADGWYDIKNDAVYYRAKASLRFYFSRKNDKYFDIAYEKGSGAPNFNRGSQFGMGLTMAF